MPLTNACFISYRHAGPASEIVRGLCGELAKQLALWSASLPVFIDDKRLKPGDYLDDELALQMCSSACMVLLFTPEYFDINHPYCAREYLGMRRLEAVRRQHFPDAFRTKGLVIPVVVRGMSAVPAELQPILCESLDDVFLSKSTVKTKSVGQRMENVAKAVFDRIEATRAARMDLAQNCGNFQFPTNAEAEPWLRNVTARPLPSPVQST